MEELIYDYAKGLSAPYWIQEVRTQKGKVLLSFSVPVQLSYFVVFFLVLVFMLTICQPIMSLLYTMIGGLSLALYFYIPNRLARLYSEVEPDGKNVLHYLVGFFRFLFEFIINKKAIYQSERVDVIEELCFEKTTL